MIDTSTWKEFCVGELFSCETTLGIPSKNDLEDGDINYVTRSAADNGFSGTCGNEDHRNKGNCITIGAEGFVAFWQSDDFVAGNKVYALRHPNMNEINGLFVCSALNALSDRYSFADARVLDKIKVEIIKLPATSDGQPDWDYMESYMKAVMEESEKSLENLKRVDETKHSIDIVEWGDFKVGDLFDIHPTRAYKMTNATLISEDGANPIIVNSGFNNGVGGFTNQDCTEKAGVITFTDTAAKSSESFFYQNEDFVGYPHVQGMYCRVRNLNKYEGMFIATVLRSAAGKFDFITKMTRDEVNEFIIKLPVNSNHELNWQYMEDYMKKTMLETEQALCALQINMQPSE